MENELEKKIEMMNKKIDEVYASVEKIRKYFLWTLIATIAVVVLPIVGLLFALPSFINTYSNLGNLGL